MNEEYEYTKDIPKIVREAVLKRDRWRCRRCGTEESLTLHHVVPRSRGGKHVPENLVTVCWYKCHMQIEARETIVKRINDVWYFSN